MSVDNTHENEDISTMQKPTYDATHELRYAIKAKRAVLPDGVHPAVIYIERGKIVEIDVQDHVNSHVNSHVSKTSAFRVKLGWPILDADDVAVMAGIVDTHVHLNEPGRTQWEGFYSGTRAAAAGGITTLVDMPLNSIPPTVKVEFLAQKKAAATGQCHVDVGFWGGVIPGNQKDLEPLVAAGALGFKCFLIDSGVPEFPNVTQQDLQYSLASLRDLGVPLLAHAELEGPILAVAKQLDESAAGRRRYRYHLDSRPKASEDEAIALLVGLCRQFRSKIHVVHHSSSTALPLLQEALDEGLPFTAETCPHYLSFAAEDIPDGATHFKCTPPIRERDNNEMLWQALKSGLLTSVVSDHSPCEPTLKKMGNGEGEGDFYQAWGGISSLELTLSATWTGTKKRGSSTPESLVDMSRWMSAAPAKLAGLGADKGKLAVGFDADIIFFDDSFDYSVDPLRLHHRHSITPYAKLPLQGQVKRTILRGHTVYLRTGGDTAQSQHEFYTTPQGKFLSK